MTSEGRGRNKGGSPYLTPASNWVEGSDKNSPKGGKNSVFITAVGKKLYEEKIIFVRTENFRCPPLCCVYCPRAYFRESFAVLREDREILLRRVCVYMLYLYVCMYVHGTCVRFIVAEGAWEGLIHSGFETNFFCR